MALTVDAYLAGLSGTDRAMVDALRRIVSRASGDLAEHIKWNAPSFTIDGDDRITLGLERKGGARLVLHRGARPKDSAGFVFDDSAKLATWPSSDRGVVQFRSLAEIEAKSAELQQLCARWVEATR